MTGGNWEVVGGKTKKSKTKGGPSKSNAKEKHKENAAFEVAGPIQESQTAFTAFLEKEKKELPKQKVNGSEVSKSNDKNAQKKKKGDKKQSPTKATLEDIFAAITEEDLKNHIATLEVLCPDSPLLWLKDIASYLNLKLDIPIEDLTFASKPLGYPSLLLHKKVMKMIVGIFNKCTPQIMQIFYDFCLQNLVQDTLKGLHTLGYRIMLQCVAHEIPSVALANLPKCMELCNSHQNRQNICLSVLWAAGQPGNNNLESGFRVWIDLMFPLIGTKNCTSYAVDYLEKLVSGDDVLKCNKSLISVRDLFPILDFIYSKDLVKSVQKRLMAIYPILKTLSYGPEPENVLRNYFPSYLRRLEPQCPLLLKEEILSSLMFCLEKDTRCYSIWRQLYTKHLVQSKLLICHINDHWEKVTPKFPKRCLRETLSVFQVTNEELLSSGKKSNNLDVEECILINKELLSKLNSGTFSWPRVVVLIILLISLLLTYDTLIHGSFKDSTTGKLMKSSGLLVICAQAGEKFMHFYDKVYKLSENYIPVVVSWVQKTLLPFFDDSLKKIAEILVLLWDNTFDVRMWCSVNIPPVLSMVEKEFVIYSTAFLTMAKSAAVVISESILIGFSHTLNFIDSVGTWIQNSPEIMNALEVIKKFAIVGIENIQQTGVYLFTTLKSYLPLPA